MAFCRFLHLVLYFNDAVNRDALEKEAEATFAILMGRVNPHDVLEHNRPLAQAAALTKAGLESALLYPLSQSPTFTHQLRLNLASFIAREDEPQLWPQGAALLHLRTETISARAYLRLWGALENMSPDAHLADALLFDRAETLAATAMAIENDMRSAARDQAQNQANLVEKEGSKAWLHYAAEARAAEAALVDLCKQQETHPVRHRYLVWCLSCVRGNRASMDVLARRYAKAMTRSP
jgi:hypothetical protein